MNHYKKLRLFTIIATLASLLLLGGCTDDKTKTQPLKVGVIAGPESQIMQVALEQAKKMFGLKSELIQFNDYITPNIALFDKSIDVNAYQHQPYLNDVNNSRHYNLVAVGKTFLYPLGAYSKKIKHIEQLSDHAKIAIPNDPSNESRALHLLQKGGLITLKDPNNITATPEDIADNPKKLVFVTLDAAQLPRSLDDVELAVINSTYSVAAGYLPDKDALLLESSQSPYVNLIVARKNNADDPRIKQLVEAYHSQPVLDKALELFKGAAIPGWK